MDELLAPAAHLHDQARALQHGDGFGGLEEAAYFTGKLFVLGDELADAPVGFGAGASLFVYVGHFISPAARNAHIVLPAATFS